MSKQPLAGTDTLTAQEAEIADYLQQHPDFFERHTHVLARLKLPHSRDGAAVSLIERQVQVLRTKNDKLETRLRDLVEIARGNDVLVGKIHRLACRLLRARSAESLLEALETSLREDFGASTWLMLLAPVKPAQFVRLTSRHLRILGASSPELKMFESLLQSGRPRCGQIRDSQRDYLFGPGTAEISSAALVPLGPQFGAGLLAIGSADAQRFHATMSTDFLARIGDLISEAIAQQ
jgi:uncharacterized protein YigA (DUF484 family)